MTQWIRIRFKACLHSPSNDGTLFFTSGLPKLASLLVNTCGQSLRIARRQVAWEQISVMNAGILVRVGMEICESIVAKNNRASLTETPSGGRAPIEMRSSICHRLKDTDNASRPSMLCAVHRGSYLCASYCRVSYSLGLMSVHRLH